MKITPTGLHFVYEVDGDSLLTSVTLPDNEELIKEHKDITEAFNNHQCKLEKLFYDNLDK